MFLWIFSLCSLMAHAYIPEWSLISSRTADQHGRGAYQIEQEVSFRRDAEVYTVKETWLVNGESGLRVTLEGRGALKGLVQGTIFYDGSLRTFTDGSQVKSQRLGEDWLEPLLHFRNGKYLRSRLVSLKILGPDSLRDRPAMNTEGTPNYEPPSFIRLSRAGSSVAWAVGASPKSTTGPAVWIEQDQFVIRKIKTVNQTTFLANEYAKFEDNFWYPRSYSYEFAGFKVDVQTLGVKSAGKLGATDNRLKSSSLVPARDQLKLPELDGLREFYLRFR